MTPAIELSDAFRIYGSGPGATVALQGLDLAVAPGEIVVVLGLVLSRLVVSVVSVSAETTSPVPPLVTDPAWGTVALALVLLAVLVLGLTELTVRHALRGQTPSRGAWTLE